MPSTGSPNRATPMCTRPASRYSGVCARGRRRAFVATGLGVLAVIAGVLIVGNDGPAPSVHTEPPASRPSQVFCNQVPRPVPTADVPADVAAWAGDRDIIGSGGLWTARSTTAVTPIASTAGGT